MKVAEFDQDLLDRVDAALRHREGRRSRHRCAQCTVMDSVDRITLLAWHARKYGDDFCDRDPRHLLSSAAHRWYCIEALRAALEQVEGNKGEQANG